MIRVRRPESIHRAGGEITGGTFEGRWHFSFGGYRDPEFRGFGVLRVFNDDTLSPGAVWPLHPHNDIEVVTYCASGEFRHADERGEGGVLRKGDVQHTTVGRGIWHSEINNSKKEPMRFIQMWFRPARKGLDPSVEQLPVEEKRRTDRLAALVAPAPGIAGGGTCPDGPALEIQSDACVFSTFLHAGRSITHTTAMGRGSYLYVLEGGPVEVNGSIVPALGSAMITEEGELVITAEGDAEVLLVEVMLT